MENAILAEGKEPSDTKDVSVLKIGIQFVALTTKHIPIPVKQVVEGLV